MTTANRLKAIWDRTMYGLTVQTVQPSYVTIRPDHVLGSDFERKLIKPDQHYFQVTVNEMFLYHNREYWVNFDPAIYAVSEFLYEHAMTNVPYLISPLKVPNIPEQLPEGMVFRNIKVAGMHPYKGGQLNLTIVLYQVKRSDILSRMLSFVDGVAQSIPFATELGSYTRIADVLLQGIETLFGWDSMKPVIGIRIDSDPDYLVARYAALINKSDVGDADLWVRDGTLLKGATATEAEHYRDADYVLYSVRGFDSRTDLDLLPVHRTWEKVRAEAMTAKTDDSWEVTRTLFGGLAQELISSPDLTEKHADQLINEYKATVKRYRLQPNITMGAGPRLSTEEAAREAKLRNVIEDILKM